MVSMSRHLAIDLGASSGRVVLGQVSAQSIELTEVCRFPNSPVHVGDRMHWDVLHLYREVLAGLRRAAVNGGADTVGVDGWGVDYALLDANGEMLGNPYHYRDPRSEPYVAIQHRSMAMLEAYLQNGLQILPINTTYQLAASRGSKTMSCASTLLLVPDLFVYWLCGSRYSELTNASTTGLLNITSRRWSDKLCSWVGLDPALLAPLVEARTEVGALAPSVTERTGLRLRVVTVGSHDTASAVLATPLQDFSAYVSLGTWALVGLELDQPILRAASLEGGFTNELGTDGRILFQRNLVGLWLLQECLKTWHDQGDQFALEDLLVGAQEVPGNRVILPLDEPSLSVPGDMPKRVRALTERLAGLSLRTPEEVVRVVLDSLAAGIAETIQDAAQLSQKTVQRVHVVGGGSRNKLLCQLLADAARLPVIAGPAEATAVGNVLAQAQAAGTVSHDPQHVRALVEHTLPTTRYEPRNARGEARC